MDAILIIIAITGGAVFGLIVGYILNGQYFEELYYIFDDERKSNIKAFKKREARLMDELARRDIKIAELEKEKISGTAPAVVITSINDNKETWIYEDYQEIDFKGDF